jgi:hypothetical protein
MLCPHPMPTATNGPASSPTAELPVAHFPPRSRQSAAIWDICFARDVLREHPFGLILPPSEPCILVLDSNLPLKTLSLRPCARVTHEQHRIASPLVPAQLRYLLRWEPSHSHAPSDLAARAPTPQLPLGFFLLSAPCLFAACIPTIFLSLPQMPLFDFAAKKGIPGNNATALFGSLFLRLQILFSSCLPSLSTARLANRCSLSQALNLITILSALAAKVLTHLRRWGVSPVAPSAVVASRLLTPLAFRCHVSWLLVAILPVKCLSDTTLMHLFPLVLQPGICSAGYYLRPHLDFPWHIRLPVLRVCHS